MNVSDVQHGRVSTLELGIDDVTSEGFAEIVGTEAQLVFPDATNDTLLRVRAEVCRVEPADSRSRATLSRIKVANLPRLVWVVSVTPKTGPLERVTIEVREFAEPHTFSESIEMGVDDKVVQEVQARRPSLLTATAVREFLTEKLLLPPLTPSEMQRAMLSGSPARDVNVERAFRLYGQGIAADVARGADERLQVVRVVDARRPIENDERRPILLVTGNLIFCDATIAGQFRGVARTELDRIVATSQSYLSLWNEYNRLEKETILRRAQAFGWVQYDKRHQLPDGRWRFYLTHTDSLDQTLLTMQEDEDVDLEAAPSPPAELMSGIWVSSMGSRRGKSIFAGSATANHARRTIDIMPLQGEEADDPPKKGVLCVSLSGDRKRLERREEAQALIATAECEMPQLGVLIEGGAVTTRRRYKEEPLSAAAREVFGGTPTEKQCEALKIALETPDIALIQGPPGTGKTKVIAALQIRLAEIAEERAGVTGQTLLTSYQHDAVENAAEKTIVFGLPAIKIGKRRGQTEEVDGYERWRHQRIESVRADLAQFPERPASSILRQVRNMAIAYVRAPRQQENARLLLDQVFDLTRGLLPPALADRIFSLRQTLSQTEWLGSAVLEDREFALKAARALRVSEASFGDDGAPNAYVALQRLNSLGVLAPEEVQLLERASDWDNPEVPPFLGELERLRECLLDRLAGARSPGPPAAIAEVETLLTEVVDALYRRVHDSIEGEEAVLYEYLDDLEHDADGVREAIRAYTTVLAATCQQAVGYQMSTAKGSRTDFENVVVDEAARANPLDLFIPMSRARRRIILVGDHRQLPHILESEIEAQLESSAEDATREALRKSLFLRLFNAMREREARDGFKRTVTLNKQYRMHRVLGRFVSKTFYEPYGEKFDSGRRDIEFEHGIDPYGKAVAAWVDTPLTLGGEESERSKRRFIEAQWIAKEVARILATHRDIGIGVVSFYAAQVGEIMRELVPFGVCVRHDDGSYSVLPDLAKTGRLRIGTVDAFQGKEFDVVFLSVTRSNALPTGDTQALRRKYGHLLVENRLCVAMSRQRCLLVVVGDAGMVATKAQMQAVPALAAFFELSGGPHGIRISA